MNLKDAFRYQNHLDELIHTLSSYMRDPECMNTVTREHLKKAANPEAENETETVASDFPVDCDPVLIFQLMQALLREKLYLTQAISVAKRGTEFDIDSALSANRQRQNVARVYKEIAAMKTRESKHNGTDFKFNADGNQVAYVYDIIDRFEPAFNRDEVRSEARRLLREADDISSEADRYLVDTEVKFYAMFNVTDSFSETVEQFVADNGR